MEIWAFDDCWGKGSHLFVGDRGEGPSPTRLLEEEMITFTDIKMDLLVSLGSADHMEHAIQELWNLRQAFKRISLEFKEAHCVRTFLQAIPKNADGNRENVSYDAQGGPAWNKTREAARTPKTEETRSSLQVGANQISSSSFYHGLSVNGFTIFSPSHLQL